ncbi:hypothetical protein C8039_18740 [Halogeometricum sp. wsp3]|nr:hypothetical protein C8039_18740 [Halogeometricum sp. wsp3]
MRRHSNRSTRNRETRPKGLLTAAREDAGTFGVDVETHTIVTPSTMSNIVSRGCRSRIGESTKP